MFWLRCYIIVDSDLLSILKCRIIKNSKPGTFKFRPQQGSLNGTTLYDTYIHKRTHVEHYTYVLHMFIYVYNGFIMLISMCVICVCRRVLYKKMMFLFLVIGFIFWKQVSKLLIWESEYNIETVILILLIILFIEMTWWYTY